MAKQRWYNERVRDDIEQFKRQLPQALIIDAQPGLGGFTLAQELAASHPSEIIEVYPEENKKLIAPSQVRALSERVRSSGDKRTVVILRAEQLGDASQNALLKMIEEPQERRHFIIVAPRVNAVLPTIRSRSQQVTLMPLTEVQSRHVLDSYSDMTDETKEQVYFLAAGLPTRMRQLAEHPQEVERSSHVVKDAKALLFTPEKYEKMRILQPYTTPAERLKALELLHTLMVMSQFLAKRSDDPARQMRQVERYVTLHQYVERYGNLRLALLSLVV